MEEIEHEIQRKIVLKLIHKPNQTFNGLWEKSEDSNKHAYHMKRLEEQGIIKKEDGIYNLTEDGKKLS